MFKEIYFPKISSTHLYAIETLEEHRGKFVLISTDHQTSGIGRRGDSWISAGENLLATFIFPTPKKDLSNLTQLLCYSTIKVLEKWALEPTFKWPNDILLDHKKVAGVMAEIKEDTSIVSIGLNVNMSKQDLDTIPIPATSLLEELRQPLSIQTIKHDLSKQFFSDLSSFQVHGFAPFFSPFAAKLAFKGKLAKVGAHEGKIEGIHSDGRLILKVNDTPMLLSESSIEILA